VRVWPPARRPDSGLGEATARKQQARAEPIAFWLARRHGAVRRESPDCRAAARGCPFARARSKFKHRSRTTREPPARDCPLRATPSTRPQPPARTDPRPHATAFPPREHTAPAPRPASSFNFAPHRHSAASPTSAAAPSAAGGARHPAGSDPAAVSPSAASNRTIAAGSWIAASTRRGPAHFGQTSTSMSNTRRSRSAHGKRCRRLRRRLPRCGTRRRARARRSACWRRTAAVADVAVVAALFAPAT
jgi:hypothetical protein